MRVALRALGLVALAISGNPTHGLAQSFADGAAQIPQGNPFNNSSTENVDYADIDGDGDYDALFADGGDDGNDQNRLWVNQGGLQGGTIGVFVDVTAAQYPNIQDTSRDADFVDIDGDGDEDLFISNSSTESDQSNRFQINQGGLQAGTAGFFVDETSTRWVNVGEIAGSSSVAASLALPTGGFIEWSCDSLFGDLDNDGDMDLVQTSYGPSFTGTVPSRFFLNDGAGFYEEFNPSGFQLPGQSIANGDPALWAEGVHQHNTMVFNGTQADIAGNTLGAELGDVDADFDLDLLIGARNQQPRLFINKLAENNGVLTTFRDATYGAFTAFAQNAGNYEQEFGDLDNDNDLDVYGLNWSVPGSSFTDVTMRNDGTGHYGPSATLSGSTSDDNDCDWFDYDNDGYLDVYVINFSGQDRLYQNGGPPSYTLSNVTAAELPSETKTGLGGDTVDVDNDGDYEVMVTNNSNQANQLWINITQIPDDNAPRVIAEQAPDQTGTSDPTPLRARVYDNASWDVIRYYDTVIEYTVNGGAPQTVTMIDAGGQNFYGVIPGGLVGVIDYTIQSTDQVSNTGTSSQLSFTVAATVNYCTAGTSASGCAALLSSSGMASATAPSGFVLSAAGVEGSKDGLFFFGSNGRQANSWGNSTSYQCVVPPLNRAGVLAGVGANGACNGAFSQDLNAHWQAKPNHNPGAGAVVQAQLWYRDPFNTANNQKTSLSDAIEFLVGI